MIDNISFYLELALNYLRPVLEILILTILIYKLLYYLRGTRGANILAGIIIVLLLLTTMSDFIKFEVINYILNNLWAILATALIVIFQPELRRAFAQLGSTPFQHKSRQKEALSEVITAMLNMAKRRIGALIVFERQIGMRTIIDDAIKLDVRLNSALVESIFFPNSPLHDGAIIVRDNRIIAAHAILPLTQDEQLSRTLGTRHRAAIGITEETDAVAVVISEETGLISIACQGKLKRDVKADKLLRYLSMLLISGDNQRGISDIFGNIDEDMSMLDTLDENGK